MALSSAEVRVAGTGHIFKAPLGTTTPTTSTATLDAGFVELGYATNGFTLTQALATTQVTAWQTLDPIRTIVTGLVRTFGFELQQTNTETLALAWGGATIATGTGGTGAYSLTIPDPNQIATGIYIIDWADGDTSQRIVIRNGQLMSLPTVTFGRSDSVSYAFTVQANAAAGGDSVSVYGVDDAVSAA